MAEGSLAGRLLVQFDGAVPVRATDSPMIMFVETFLGPALLCSACVPGARCTAVELIDEQDDAAAKAPCTAGSLRDTPVLSANPARTSSAQESVMTSPVTWYG